MVVYTGGQLIDKTITKVVVQDGVREIDCRAFTKCPNIQSITIPNSVTSIGYEAFEGLENLETIIIPVSVETIGGWAFKNCTALKAIVIPEGVTEIQNHTFLNCHSLKRITFPKSLTTIGYRAFQDCTSLEQVDIPSGITVILEAAFCGCISLHTVTLPATMEKLGRKALPQMEGIFRDCTSLRSIRMPDGMKVIPEYSLCGCTSLHTVTLPPTIEEFGSNAFYGCDNLDSFIIRHGLPVLKDGFDPFNVGLASFKLIKQILSNASGLTSFYLREYNLKDDGIQEALELVSYCPTLREVDLSRNRLSVGVYEKMAAQDIPGHLRLLQIKGQSKKRKKTSSSPEHFIRLLERNPKLVIKTDKFWDDSEDDKVRHHLDLNEYGCRSFTVPDSHWPELIETLALLEEEGERETKPSNNNIKKKKKDRARRIRRAANILFSMLHHQLDVLLNYQQRHRRLRSNTNFSSQSNLATVPSVDNVDAIVHRLRDRLQQQQVEIKEKDDEIKEKDATIKEKNEEIKAKDATIKAKFKETKGKDAKLKEKDAKIKGKDKEIKEKDKEIVRLRRLLEQSNNTAYASQETASNKRTSLK